MNNTPNYGFHLQICGADGIDRELNRIEKRIDCLSRCKIDCLSKYKCDGYSKDEADKLLDGKVDKTEGCRLICEDELQNIHDALEDRYPKEKVYTKTEVDEMLSKEKVYTKTEIDEMLSNKVTGNWTIFNSLQSLGVDKYTSIDDIVESMPDYSILFANVYGGDLSVYPTEYGFLTIIKLGRNRCRIEYSKNLQNRFWTGIYHEDNTRFAGWVEYVTTEYVNNAIAQLRNELSAQ